MIGILGSLCAIFVIPLIALALEPTDPITFCDRFIDKTEIEKCQTRTASENVDWYAGSICNMQKDDAAFWKCWDSVKNKSINLQSLKKCEEIEEGDAGRQACVDASFSQSRSPASTNSSDIFQPLKSKKKK